MQRQKGGRRGRMGRAATCPHGSWEQTWVLPSLPSVHAPKIGRRDHRHHHRRLGGMIAFLACSVHGKCHLELQKIQHRALINDIHARPPVRVRALCLSIPPPILPLNFRTWGHFPPMRATISERRKERGGRGRLGTRWQTTVILAPTFMKTRTHYTRPLDHLAHGFKEGSYPFRFLPWGDCQCKWDARSKNKPFTT